MPARSRIVDQIAAAGGWISFARYMHLALHEPGLGYYASGARKFGPGGDFVTAPELGSLFGRTLARQLGEFERILEIGAGSGALAHVVSHVPELRAGCQNQILAVVAQHVGVRAAAGADFQDALELAELPGERAAEERAELGRGDEVAAGAELACAA